jgi:hypothetical protein
MLTYAELVDIERSLRGRRVLSVYVGGPAPDPAGRHAWRRAVDGQLGAIRDSLQGASHEEREAFGRASALLGEQMDAMPGVVGAPGWVAFVTAEGVRSAAPVPAPVASLVAWEVGARIAPYVRALKQERPVWVAVVDTRQARLYRYRAGALDALDTLRAHASVGPFDHMGDAPREHFHPGTRGTTGTDAAGRERRAATDRMVVELADRLDALSGGDGWIVLGGTPAAAGAALRALPAPAAARARVLPGLSVWSTDADIRWLAAEGASALRAERDGALVADLLERAGSRGRSAIGAPAVLHALDAGAVQELVLSYHFVERQPAEAEAAVRAAFDQRAAVEVASGRVGERLDRDGGGVAALLRFVPSTSPPPDAGAAMPAWRGEPGATPRP